MLKAESAKKKERREKFKKIGAAISALKPYYIDYDYHTGKESRFHLVRFDNQQRSNEAELNSVNKVPFCPWPEDRCEVPLGPEFKTPQWIRTVRE